MPDPRSSPPSEETPPRSGSPTVASARPASTSVSKLPYWITALGLLGVVGFVLVRLTLPPRDVATDCLRVALAEKGFETADLSADAEIVTLGKLDVAGKQSAQIAKGLLSDPIRRKAIERCRGVYVQRMGVSPASPLIHVESGVVRVSVKRTLERGSNGKPEAQYPVQGARVFIENVNGQGSCDTASSGYCELTIQNLGHDAKINVAAKLPNGNIVSRSATVIALLQNGLTLEALERTPQLTLSVSSCADRTPLSGAIVRAEAAGSNLWSTECGPARPEQLDRCREMMGRHGDVTFHYDTRPERLTVTIIPPGEGAHETREVVLGSGNGVELTYGPCPENAGTPAVDCQATRRALESAAQLTRVPAGAMGHELDVLVEVMSSGMVADIQPASSGDPRVMAALRLQLAGLRGLAGPCRDMPVSLHY